MDPESSIRKGKKQLASTRSCNRSPFDIEPFPISKLIEEQLLIKPGLPENYLLPTKKTSIDGKSAVRRWTFGKRDESKSTKTILIVGETGTGKSTLINTMVNFMLGVRWEDRIWFQITEEDARSQAKSQTSAITVYELFLETSSSCLRIIDTPGYGDTGGRESDQQIAEHLNVLFRSEDGIHEIDAVGLVVKASQNRLTDFQHYIFDAVLSLFGKDIERNIVTFITHSDGLPAANVINALKDAEVPCAKDTRGKPLHFMFNNRQNETYEEDQEVAYQGFWNLGYRSVEKFFSNLEEFNRVDLQMTVGVLRDRKILEACVHNLQDAIEMEELKQNELKQTQTVLDQNRGKYEKKVMAKDFTYEVEEPCRVEKPIPVSKWKLTGQAMCCTVCKENCHYPGCWWVRDNSWCSVMENYFCKTCTGKCHFSVHVKWNQTYHSSTKKVRKTADDLKDAYEKEEESKTALLNTKIKMCNLLEEAYQCIMELQEMALKKVALSTDVYLGVIKKMEEAGEDTDQPQESRLEMKIKAQTLKEIKEASHKKEGGLVLPKCQGAAALSCSS
ncbi:uncharacterized protein LOC105913341 [Clupea harengus]|uniref:Uncharacterized protein LOC105913341 n=1 Tax=Clupea harengus TaxID=7950 RepID=A0A6P8FLK9_CLUHA|nr:uncharacterized protein LOC105913341 [Clupea harengus]